MGVTFYLNSLINLDYSKCLCTTKYCTQNIKNYLTMVLVLNQNTTYEFLFIVSNCNVVTGHELRHISYKVIVVEETVDSVEIEAGHTVNVGSMPLQCCPLLGLVWTVGTQELSHLAALVHYMSCQIALVLVHVATRLAREGFVGCSYNSTKVTILTM